MRMPVGINALSIGRRLTGASSEARRSMPAERGVAYAGRGLRDEFMILTLTADMIQTKRCCYRMNFRKPDSLLTDHVGSRNHNRFQPWLKAKRIDNAKLDILSGKTI